MKAETVTAISAATIALASLFVAVWNAKQTRRHYRLSVTPHLRIDYVEHPDGEVRVTLSNNGLGSALIKSFSVYLEGDPAPVLDAARLVKQGDGIGTFFFFMLSDDDALSAGESKVLLLVETSKDDFERREKIQAWAAKVIIKMGYESLYGDTLSLNRTATGRLPE